MRPQQEIVSRIRGTSIQCPHVLRQPLSLDSSVEFLDPILSESRSARMTEMVRSM